MPASPEQAAAAERASAPRGTGPRRAPGRDTGAGASGGGRTGLDRRARRLRATRVARAPCCAPGLDSLPRRAVRGVTSQTWGNQVGRFERVSREAWEEKKKNCRVFIKKKVTSLCATRAHTRARPVWTSACSRSPRDSAARASRRVARASRPCPSACAARAFPRVSRGGPIFKCPHACASV